MSASATPDAETLLRAIAAASPGLWYAQRHADAHGIPREALNEPLWLLRQTGLIEVGDWVKGLGQGLRLSPQGEKALAVPTLHPARPTAPPPQIRTDRLTELEAGDEARNAVLDPPPAIVAPSLLYANIAWFAVGCIVAWRGGVGMEFLKGDSHPGTMSALLNTGAMTAVSMWSGEWWRLATNCFVHIGLFHLLCNMLMLGMMGPFAEGLWGRWRFATIYAVSGLVGSVTAVALHPLAESGAETLTAGASGALWGMLAAVVVWVIRARRYLPPELARERLQRLMFIVVMNAAVSFAPGVSAEAHFGGGMAGLVIAWSVSPGHRNRRLWAIGGVAFTLLLATILLLGAIRWSENWRTVKDRDQVRQTLEQARKHWEQEAPERAAVLAALGDGWQKVSPGVVMLARVRFLEANPARIATDSSGPASLRKAAEQLRETAANLLNRLPTEGEVAGRFREYCSAVVVYAVALRDELDRPGRKLTPELDAAWQTWNQAQLKLGRWE